MRNQLKAFAVLLILALLLLPAFGQPSDARTQPSNWITRVETSHVHDVRQCLVYKPTFSFGVSFLARKGERYVGIAVGMNKYHDSYLRIDHEHPVKVEDGRVLRPLEDDRLVDALEDGEVLYIEWRHALDGTQQESTALEGFANARQECMEALGWE